MDPNPDPKHGLVQNVLEPEYWLDRAGDLVMSDNLAVGHEASPDTQLPRQQIGLRVMHRVTVAGKSTPLKN